MMYMRTFAFYLLHVVGKEISHFVKHWNQLRNIKVIVFLSIKKRKKMWPVDFYSNFLQFDFYSSTCVKYPYIKSVFTSKALHYSIFSTTFYKNFLNVFTFTTESRYTKNLTLKNQKQAWASMRWRKYHGLSKWRYCYYSTVYTNNNFSMAHNK